VLDTLGPVLDTPVGVSSTPGKALATRREVLHTLRRVLDTPASIRRYKTIHTKQDAEELVGVSREQKMLKGHLPRVIYHQVY